MIHCNFGWGGTANGYYYYGAFDLRNGPEAGYDGEDTSSSSDKYYDMGEYKYEFLQNYDYLKTIEKRPSELTAADMKMVYYSLTDFSSQTKSPVIVFTSAPTLEKEHTLTLRWTTVEGDVKTASVTCTPEVDPALQ